MLAELTRNGYLIEGVGLLPRVSSILGVIAKPGLDGWRKKVGFEEAERVMVKATTFGTLVHKGCERVALGESAEDVCRALTVMGDLTAAQCVEAFGRWMSDAVAEVLAVERTVWSERFRYAGTTDLLVQLHDGRRMVADVKTSKSLSETYRLQLEAYRLALEEQGEPYDGRVVVWLPSSHPGVVAEREYADHDTDRRTWRACLALHRFMQENRDGWKEDRAVLDAIAEGRWRA